MKRIILAVLFLLFFANLSFAANPDDYILSARELVTDITVNSSVSLVSEGRDFAVEDFRADLLMFPKNSSRQTVISLVPVPDADIFGDKISFFWRNPKDKSLNYSVRSNVKTSNEFARISSKVSYPLSSVKSLESYLKPTDHIDYNDAKIIATASQLAEGYDDLFMLENELSSFIISNIQYNLSTLTAEANQPASWVLTNRYGVCDEITNLFIAFNRALGIPARAVVGVAYTNSPLFNYSWGPHAWAEVYFPGYGWVPFDLTYGEIGWVDAGHIEMMHSVDSNEPSSKFEWRSSGVDIEPQSLDIDTRVISSSGKAIPLVNVDVSLFDDKVGFGSYNLVEAKINNLMDYYVPATLYLANVESVEIVSKNQIGVVLAPREERSVFWIIKVDSDLSKDYIYTFPIYVYSVGNVSDKTDLVSERRATVHSFTDISEVFNLKNEEIKKVYSSEVAVNCSSDESVLYVNESSFVRCEFWNHGTKNLNSLNVCLGACKIIDLGINQKTVLNFSFVPKKVSDRALVSVRNNDISKSFDVGIFVSDVPSLKISNIELPVNVSYNDTFRLSVLLDKQSVSDVENVSVNVVSNGYSKTFFIPEVNGTYDVELSLVGSDLRPGINLFNISAYYLDKNKKNYSLNESVSVNLTNLTFWQHVKIFGYQFVEFFFGR